MKLKAAVKMAAAESERKPQQWQPLAAFPGAHKEAIKSSACICAAICPVKQMYGLFRLTSANIK